MKPWRFAFAALFCFFLNICSFAQDERLLSERNSVYNELQLKLFSDTVAAARKIEMLQYLISLDNEIIDDWIPSLFREIDSLKSINARKEQAFRDKKKNLTERMKLFMYAGAGLSVITFILFIFVLILFFSRRKLKRKLKQTMNAENELEICRNELDEKKSEINRQKSTHSELENKITELEQEKIKLDQNYKLSLQSLQNEAETIKTELQALSDVLESVKSEKDQEVKSLQMMIAQKEEDHGLLQAQLKKSEEDFQDVIQNEREESILKLREKEILLDELRNELRQTKSLLEEKERDDAHIQFREVTDAIEETNRLRRLYDEQAVIIDEYRKALEKELETRKELEVLIRDMMRK